MQPITSNTTSLIEYLNPPTLVIIQIALFEDEDRIAGSLPILRKDLYDYQSPSIMNPLVTKVFSVTGIESFDNESLGY